MRMAIVHDWLLARRGAERVLAAMGRVFPGADLFTIVGSPPETDRDFATFARAHTTRLGHLPGVARYYRALYPVMEPFVRAVDLRAYGTVLISAHCIAHHVAVGHPRRFIYMHAPPRYLYAGNTGIFQGILGRAARAALSPFRDFLIRHDQASIAQTDRLAANSRHISERIRWIYEREATVISPPIAGDFFLGGVDPENKGEYLLYVNALLPYKFPLLVVHAAKKAGVPVIIVGDGPLAPAVRVALPRGSRWFPRLGQAELVELMRRARAVICPGEEDFGLVAAEAQAVGTPVIALARGGARETVLDAASQPRGRATGVWFHEPTAAALAGAIREFLRREHEFDPAHLRAHARQFSETVFAARLRAWVLR